MKFRLFTRTRDKPVNRTAGSSYSFLMGGSTSGKNVNERSAMQMTAVYACVRILSEAIAGLPLHLYRYNEDGSKTKALDADFIKLGAIEGIEKISESQIRVSVPTGSSMGDHEIVTDIETGVVTADGNVFNEVIPEEIKSTSPKKGRKCCIYFFNRLKSKNTPFRKNQNC